METTKKSKYYDHAYFTLSFKEFLLLFLDRYFLENSNIRMFKAERSSQENVLLNW
jgi:hypothetical protein